MTIHFFGDQTYRSRFIKSGCKYNDNGILITGILKVYLRIYYARLQMVFDNKPMDVSLTQKKMQVMATLGFLTQKVKLQVV
jgi:hypothetical protein